MHDPRGVYSAVLTPFEPNGAPAHRAFIEHCRSLLANGCDGLSILGTTGEANSMTVDERIGTLEALVRAGVDPQRILPGVGCCAIGDTVRLAKHALGLGVTDLLVLPPFYYKIADDDGLYDAYAQTIEQIGDDRARLYFYNIPQVSGIAISPALVRRVQAKYPAIVAGVKDSSKNPETMRAYNAIPNLRVFVGTEKLLLANMRAGGVGTIAAFANFDAMQLHEVVEHWQDPGADDRQAAIDARGKAIEGVATVAALKAITEAATGDAAWRTIRPPLRALDDEQRTALVAAWSQTAVVA